MRSLNYKETYQKLLTPEIVSYLAQIHEQKGQQNLFIEAHKGALSELLEIAKIQSTEASNRIEVKVVDGNDAIRFYEKHGFRTVSHILRM